MLQIVGVLVCCAVVLASQAITLPVALHDVVEYSSTCSVADFGGAVSCL